MSTSAVLLGSISLPPELAWSADDDIALFTGRQYAPLDGEYDERDPDQAEADELTRAERILVKQRANQKLDRGIDVLEHTHHRQRDPPGRRGKEQERGRRHRACQYYQSIPQTV